MWPAEAPPPAAATRRIAPDARMGRRIGGGEIDAAAEQFNAAAALLPASPVPAFNLGVLYQQAKRPQEPPPLSRHGNAQAFSVWTGASVSAAGALSSNNCAGGTFLRAL